MQLSGRHSVHDVCILLERYGHLANDGVEKTGELGAAFFRRRVPNALRPLRLPLGSCLRVLRRLQRTCGVRGTRRLLVVAHDALALLRTGLRQGARRALPQGLARCLPRGLPRGLVLRRPGSGPLWSPCGGGVGGITRCEFFLPFEGSGLRPFAGCLLVLGLLAGANDRVSMVDFCLHEHLCVIWISEEFINIVRVLTVLSFFEPLFEASIDVY